jgi:hypothetical protein
MDSDESKKFLFTQPKATITIPFELSRNGFFFTMRVNDGGPLWFTLDSGSAANYLGMDQAEKLGLEFHGTKTVHAAGGQSIKVHIADGISFALPGLVSKEHQIHAASLPGLSQWGRSVDGLLGYNFLERFTVTIDYDAKQLTIMEPSRFNYTGPGEILPIQFDRDQPYVRAMIKVPGKPPEESLFLIDTGSQDEVDHPLIGRETGRIFGKVETLQLGKIQLHDLHGANTGEGLFSHLIGGGVLHRFKVIFDYTRKRMILETTHVS